jgi:hypothetical protein
MGDIEIKNEGSREELTLISRSASRRWRRQPDLAARRIIAVGTLGELRIISPEFAAISPHAKAVPHAEAK